MAERGGFEPPIPLQVCLISSQVHSTGLCHLSALQAVRRAPGKPGTGLRAASPIGQSPRRKPQSNSSGQPFTVYRSNPRDGNARRVTLNTRALMQRLSHWTPELEDLIHSEALAAGFHLAGVTSAAPDASPGSDRERFSAWVEGGRAGEMEYLKRRDP